MRWPLGGAPEHTRCPELVVDYVGGIATDVLCPVGVSMARVPVVGLFVTVPPSITVSPRVRHTPPRSRDPGA